MKQLGDFYVVVADVDGKKLDTADFPTLIEAEEYASRSVGNSDSLYRIASVYARVKSCRTPRPKVEWDRSSGKLLENKK